MEDPEKQTQPQEAEGSSATAEEIANQQEDGQKQEPLVKSTSNDEPPVVSLAVGEQQPIPLSQEANHIEPPSPTPRASSPTQIAPGQQTPRLASSKLANDTTNERQQKKTSDEEKNGIYKALAIKLKKELVKTREEFQKLRDENGEQILKLKSLLSSLEESSNSERLHFTSANATLEANNKSLRSQLESAENDLHSLQTEFENYKIRASQIMQQNRGVQFNTSKTFEEDRYKQLKQLNCEQRDRIERLEAQLAKSYEKNKELELECKTLAEQLDLAQNQLESYKSVDKKCAHLTKENELLKFALKQYGERLRDPKQSVGCDSSCSTISPEHLDAKTNVKETRQADRNGNLEMASPTIEPEIQPKSNNKSTRDDLDEISQLATASPSATSTITDAQTDSSSSFDGSTSGYVHIKPATFEIIRSSSALEDAQKHIDTLTKVYLESESMNSLLSEQVKALKEEIRRIQRGNDRMELAENLEYLKNIVFRFISLESNQSEQRKRLVPVLSAVLKLSADETAKLNSLAASEKSSLTSSFFKL